MIRALAGALLVLVALAVPASAAEQATSAEVRRLAADAQHDPAALERLRRIDVVDGRPVDLASALGGDETAARLRTLAGGARSEVPSDVRVEARRILSGPDFREHHPPRPLRGVLRWLGDRVRPITDALDRTFGSLDLRGWLLTGLSALVVLAAGVFGALVVRRRTLAVIGDGRGGRTPGARESPEALERRAERAAAAGDHELALRLRFRAGLLRLDTAGALRYRPSLTTGAVTREVHSATLVELASTVDEVLYGGRPASAEDVEDARRRWPTVLAEARSR